MIPPPSSSAAARGCFSALQCAIFGLVFAAPATAAPIFSIAGATPDLSQHQNGGWSNYCAPTAGADVVYFQSNTYGSLLPPSGFGPGVAQDDEATDMIGDLVPVLPMVPLPGSLADRMGTDFSNGTTPLDLAIGLDGYLEDNDGLAGAFWDTQVLFGAAIGGQGLWDMARSQLELGAGVILLVDWATAGSAPPGANEEQSYDVPTEPGLGGNDPIAHAITLVGFDVSDPAHQMLFFHDPANNLSTGHVWPAEGFGADGSNVTVNVSDLTVTVAGSSASVYGAVITLPIPEPSTALLLAAGVAGLGLRRRPRPR